MHLKRKQFRCNCLFLESLVMLQKSFTDFPATMELLYITFSNFWTFKDRNIFDIILRIVREVERPRDDLVRSLFVVH